MKFAFLVLLAVTTLSCAMLKEESSVSTKTFAIDKLWVRNTLLNDYYGFRHPHRMTPIIYKDMIIQGNAIDGIGAFDQLSGNQRWFLPIKGGVEAGASLLDDNLFAGASDGFFYAIEALTGNVLWKTPINAETLSTPTVADDLVYFIAGNNRVYALNTVDGKVKWSYSRQETTNLSIRGGSQPAIAGDKLLLGFSDGVFVALNINDGKVVWEKSLNRSKRFRDVDAHPVVKGDKVFVASFDQALYCLEVSSGKVLWRVDQGGFSAVLLDGEKLYYATTDGFMNAHDQDSGKLIWSHKIKKGHATRPTLYRGLLVYGEYEGDLVALDSLTGKEVGSYSPGRGLMSQPLIIPESGKTFFISVNANLFALKLHWKTLKDKWPWENDQ